MSNRIPVREIIQASQWLRVILTASLCYAVANAGRENNELAWWSASAVAAISMTYESAVVFFKPGIAYVLSYQDAFDFVENLQSTFIPDYSVSAIAVAMQNIYYLGNLQEVRYRYTIWSDLSTNEIVLESKSTPSSPDPLGPLTTRLTGRVLSRAREQLLSGRAVHGDTWTLDARRLRWDAQGKSHSIAPDQLAACERFDNHIHIWQEGQQAPIAKFPESGRNAVLLPLLLQSPLEEANLANDQPGIMGRLLLQRQINAEAKLYWIAAAAFALLFGGFMHLAIVRDTITWWIATAMMLTSIPVVLMGYLRTYVTYYFYERALKQTGPFGNHTLYYSEIDHMRYHVSRNFHKGIYCGIDVDMLLSPEKNCESDALHYQATVWKHDRALDFIESRISKFIAARINRELAQGQTINWTEDVFLEPDALRYRTEGQSEFQLLPYCDLSRVITEDGILRLFHRGEDQPVLEIGPDSMNFYAMVSVLETQRTAAILNSVDEATAVELPLTKVAC